MERYHDFTLDNGLRVGIQNTATLTVYGQLRVYHGAIHEQPGEQGFAHLLEHLLVTGGTMKFSPEQTQRRVNTLGYFNAHTSLDSTLFHGDFLAEQTPHFLHTVAGMAFEPLLDKDKLIEEQRTVVQELAEMQSGPRFLHVLAYMAALFGNGDPRTYYVAGEDESILAATPASLKAFHSRGYSPNNAVLILTGGLPEDIEAIVEETFGGFCQGEGAPFKFPPVRTLEDATVLPVAAPDLYNPDRPQSSSASLTLGINGPTTEHPDRHPFEILTWVLGQGNMASRLFKRLRTEERLVYGIWAEYVRANNSGTLEINTNVSTSSIEQATHLIFEELARMKSNGISIEELEQAKNAAKYEFSSGIETNRGKARAIRRKFEFGTTPQQELASLDAVMPQEVVEVAQKYLPANRDGAYVLMVRNPLLKS